MSFTLISWNIQKLNLDKASEFGKNIADAIKDAGGDSFVAILYENKNNPKEVGNLIRNYLPNSYFMHVFSGGGKYTHENVLVFYKGVNWSGGNAIDCSQAFDKLFDDETNELKSRSRPPNLRASQYSLDDVSPYSTSTQTSFQLRRTIQPKEWYRSPVLLVFKAKGIQYRVAVVHAPGPDNMNSKIFEVYLQGVENAGANIFIGDFNMKSSPKNIGSWQEIPFLADAGGTGTTTIKSGTQAGNHSWDRMFVSSNANIHITNPTKIAAESRVITDHLGLVVTLGQTCTGILVSVVTTVAKIGGFAAMVGGLIYTSPYIAMGGGIAFLAGHIKK